MALDAADERQSPWVSESVRRRQGVQAESVQPAPWWPTGARGRITGRCSAPVQWKRGQAGLGKEGCMSIEQAGSPGCTGSHWHSWLAGWRACGLAAAPWKCRLGCSVDPCSRCILMWRCIVRGTPLSAAVPERLLKHPHRLLPYTRLHKLRYRPSFA